MLVLVDIMHLGDQGDLQQAQTELDQEMTRMGFTKRKQLDEPRLRHAYYDVDDMRVGVKPAYLHEKIVQITQHPDRCRFEAKLIADRNMPQA